MPDPLGAAFTLKLIHWYHKYKRDLPWRRTRDPYKIWISEVMLQQTTVKAVLNYYENWIRQFPTVKDLAEARLEVVLRAWQGLGYYNRARNLHKAAIILHEKYDGRLPRTSKELANLPGFGPYTSGAVASIAYNLRVPIIDANVRRVFMRLLAIQGKSVNAQDKVLLPKIEILLPKHNVGDFNQGLMELGALICRSKEPICSICPVRQFCKAYEKGVQEVIPLSIKAKIKKITAAVGLFYDIRGRILIQKRPDTGLLAGLWEFPGGKAKPGESLVGALKREIREELGVGADICRKVCCVSHLKYFPCPDQS